MALAAGVVLAVHWTTFFQAIQSSSVAIGTITFSAFPLFLTFLEPLIFHEPLRPRSLVSALVLLLGVGITVPAFSLENQITLGILWGAGFRSGLCGALPCQPLSFPSVSGPDRLPV